MLRYLFRYSDGYIVMQSFKTEKEMQWFAYNEGDHLMEVTPIKEEYTWEVDRKLGQKN